MICNFVKFYGIYSFSNIYTSHTRVLPLQREHHLSLLQQLIYADRLVSVSEIKKQDIARRSRGITMQNHRTTSYYIARESSPPSIEYTANIDTVACSVSHTH